MASLNKCFFIGNLGRDPEMHHFQDGTAVCNVSIACTETWKDKSSGERKEKTEWVPLVFMGALAEVAGKYLKKGSQVHVEGKFTTRKWQDKDGNERYSTEVRVSEMTMLGGRPQGEGGAPAPHQRQQAAAPAPRQSAPAPRAPQGGFDDDVPF